MKITCMDNSEIKSYNLTDVGGDISFTSWNIKNSLDIIKKELTEYYEEYKIINLKIISKKEMAYSSARYFEGQDVNDEGFSHFINYCDNWKKGLGKCTTFTISYDLVFRGVD